MLGLYDGIDSNENTLMTSGCPIRLFWIFYVNDNAVQREWISKMQTFEC